MRLIHWGIIGTIALIGWAFWPVLKTVFYDLFGWPKPKVKLSDLYREAYERRQRWEETFNDINRWIVTPSEEEEEEDDLA